MLGGEYEYLLPTGEKKNDKKRDALAKIFSYLDYDFGMLSPTEKEYLEKSSSGIPKNWKTYPDFTLNKITLKNGKTVGIVTFPNLEGNSEELPDSLVTDLTKNLRQFKKQADIIIGMSPWGYFREKALLENHNYLECPLDILLGSGNGPGLTGRLIAQNKTLWVRCYPTGKAVSRIDILDWPKRDSDFRWTLGQNIRCLIQSLLINTREDPKVLDLLTGISDEK